MFKVMTTFCQMTEPGTAEIVAYVKAQITRNEATHRRRTFTMHRSLTLTIATIALSTLILVGSLLPSASYAADPRGAVIGHVWLDANCDGHKDAGEGDVPLVGIVQLVGTGKDRVLNPGDRAQTYYTDAQGSWEATNLRVNDIDDGQPLVYAVAVGTGTAMGLGYKVSPEGGDSILSGSSHASATFQLQDGQTIQMGEIGVCQLPRVFLPSVVKQ